MKTLQLSPSQRSNNNLFLIAAEDHNLPSRCEGFIKCKIIDEEGNITQQTKIIVEPMKEFEDKSHLLIARSLKDMVDDVVWVRVLNPTLEPKEVYKNARIACAENIEKFSRVQQNSPDNNGKHRDEFDLRNMWTQVQWTCLVRKWQKWGHFAENMKQCFRETQMIWDFATEFIIK